MERTDDEFQYDRMVQLLENISKDKYQIVVQDLQSVMWELAKIFDVLGGGALKFIKDDILYKRDEIDKVVAEERQLAEREGRPQSGEGFPLHRVQNAMARDTEREEERRKGGDAITRPFSHNLLRQRRTIEFLALLMEKMYEDDTLALRDAVSAAYSESLAPVHSWMIRTAVNVGVYALPTKESFLDTIHVPRDHQAEGVATMKSHLIPLRDNLYELFEEHGLSSWK
mmetsp:Transcript_13054/g.37034  ORF Transcript_13054/g.37034 Transcript_13054/m.37034 type:complete len:227 (-) Transcript_13054:72-752(-)